MIATTCSNGAVAQKWWMLYPARKSKDGSAAEPTEFELNSIHNDSKGLKDKRVRLSSISWFMRFLSERIAKEANKRGQCSARFWVTRLRVQPLLDETTIVACMAYVDLNPIRAGIAATPETSDFTSVKERIEDRASASEVSTADAQDHRIEHGEKAGSDSTGSEAHEGA